MHASISPADRIDQDGCLLVRLLLGDAEARRSAPAPLGFSADQEVRALRARSPHEPLQLQAELRRSAGYERLATAIYQGDVVALTTAIPHLRASAATVCVGEPSMPRNAAASFCSASRTLDAVWPLRLTGTFQLADIPLLAAVAHDDDVGQALEHRYFAATLLGKLGAATEETLRAFLANNLDANATAEAIAIHPNTVRYRLRQFSYATGVELTSIEDLFGIWWALKRRERRAALGEMRRPVEESLVARASTTRRG